MSPEDVFTLLCIVSLLATALVHSLLGERRLIGPLLLERHGPLADDLGRLLLRGVWHFMSVLFLVIAAALWSSLGANDRSATALLAATAIGIGGAWPHVAMGIPGTRDTIERHNGSKRTPKGFMEFGGLVRLA